MCHKCYEIAEWPERLGISIVMSLVTWPIGLTAATGLVGLGISDAIATAAVFSVYAVLIAYNTIRDWERNKELRSYGFGVPQVTAKPQKNNRRAAVVATKYDTLH